jgi:S1-C subfamily serine protease
VPKAKQDEVIRQLQKMVDSGRLAYNEKAIDAAAINLLLSNPDNYFAPGSDRATDNFTLVASGSGFFVNQDGYLITAAHVVSPAKSDILAEVLDIMKQPDAVAQIQQDIKDAAYRGLNVSLSDAQAQQLTSWAQRYDEKYTTIDKVDSKYYIGFGTAVAGQSLTAIGTRASIVAQEPVPPGRDVAVLKADVSTVPALALANGDPQTSAATYAIGYPREGYLSEPPASDATVKATLSTGAVNNQKSMDGWTAIGTNANVTHGNSGGPVLDKDGRVLGIVSFGDTDGQGKPIAGQNYFVPVSVLKQELQKASIKPAAGTLTSTYYAALSQGDFRHYRKELRLLTDVQSGSANEPYVKDDIATIQSAILAGQDQTPPKLSTYLPEAGGATGAALIFLIATLVWPRRRDAAAPTAEAVTSAAEGVTVAALPVEPAAAEPAAVESAALESGAESSPEEVVLLIPATAEPAMVGVSSEAPPKLEPNGEIPSVK